MSDSDKLGQSQYFGFRLQILYWRGQSSRSYRHLHNPLNKVGDGFADHGYWGRPEEMNMARPTFTLNTNAPGSDLAAETAAALVWFSIQFLT